MELDWAVDCARLLAYLVGDSSHWISLNIIGSWDIVSGWFGPVFEIPLAFCLHSQFIVQISSPLMRLC